MPALAPVDSPPAPPPEAGEDVLVDDCVAAVGGVRDGGVVDCALFIVRVRAATELS